MHINNLLEMPVYFSIRIRYPSIVCSLIIRTPIVFKRFQTQPRNSNCFKHFEKKVLSFTTHRRKVQRIHNEAIPAGLSFRAANIPMNMQRRENKTGIRKAGATLLIIFTPPKTINTKMIVTIIPQTCKSCKLGVVIGSATAVPFICVIVSA